MTLAVLALAVVTTPAFAATTSTGAGPGNGAWGGMMRNRAGGMMKPAVFGTVEAINGNTITVNSKQGLGAAGTTTTATTTTFTVDATNAKIMKNNVAGTIASIAVGDTIIAQGTVSGTNVVATNIRDGVMMRGGDGANKPGQGEQGLPTVAGNGQPVVAGTVSSINGSTLVITNKSNVSYTVDATNSKVMQDSNSAATISNIAVGDMIVVQGTVNGNTVVASSIIDQAKPATTTAGTTPHKGFFSGIGSFFAHIFGF